MNRWEPFTVAELETIASAIAPFSDDLLRELELELELRRLAAEFGDDEGPA